MPKYVRYFLITILPILTGVIWLVWKFMSSDAKDQFLDRAATWVGDNVFGDIKKRRSTYRYS